MSALGSSSDVKLGRASAAFMRARGVEASLGSGTKNGNLPPAVGAAILPHRRVPVPRSFELGEEGGWNAVGVREGPRPVDRAEQDETSPERRVTCNILGMGRPSKP